MSFRDHFDLATYIYKQTPHLYFTFVITSDAKIALINCTCNTYRNTDSTFEVLSRMAQLLMQQLGRGIRN